MYAIIYLITKFNGLQNTVISKQSTARNEDVLIEAASLDHICNERNISSKMILSFINPATVMSKIIIIQFNGALKNID